MTRCARDKGWLHHAYGVRCVLVCPESAEARPRVSLNPCLAAEVNAFMEKWFAEPLRNAMLSKLKRFAWIMKKVLCFRGIDFLIGKFAANGIKRRDGGDFGEEYSVCLKR